MWAFDCENDAVFSIGTQSESGFALNEGWRLDPRPVTHELMDGVAWDLRLTLCAGWRADSWRLDDLPY